MRRRSILNLAQLFKMAKSSKMVKLVQLAKHFLYASVSSIVAMSVAGQVHAMNSANSPKGYTVICDYGQTCAVAKPNLVAFGHRGQYAFKIMNGAFLCNERAFNRTNFSSLNNDANNASSQPSCSVAVKIYRQNINAVQSASELTDGAYAIISRHSQKALTLSKTGELQQAPYTGAANQHFIITKRNDGYFAIAAKNKKALEIKDWQTDDGAQITTGIAADSWNQHWLISDSDTHYVSIASRFNGKSLDLFELNTNNSAQVRLWTYWGGNNQQWQLIPAKPPKDDINQ